MQVKFWKPNTWGVTETLLLYIAATNRVVSTAIVVEREEVRHVYKVQRLVYIISEVLNESKTCYP
jgi:hypothetical protein